MLFKCENGVLRPFDREAERLIEAGDGKTLDMKRITRAKRRSLDQNRLYHMWNRMVEIEQGEEPGWAHCWHKYRFGVAIIRPRFPEQIQRLHDMFRGMEEPQRLEFMEIVPCSSLMTKKEMTEYMTTIQRHWAGQGLVLEGSEDYL